MVNDREKILMDLISLRLPLDQLKEALISIPWDPAPKEGVKLTVKDTIKVLRKFMNRELESREVEEWASLIECRDDIHYETRRENDLKNFLFEFAHPEINEPITLHLVSRWINRLESKIE